jgi:hypothetical protein
MNHNQNDGLLKNDQKNRPHDLLSRLSKEKLFFTLLSLPENLEVSEIVCIFVP